MPIIEQSGWTVHWRMTESAGLMVYLVDFKKKRILWEASLPYITLNHQQQDISVDHGSDHAHGSFWTPLGERSLASGIRRNTFAGGFEIAADFDCAPFSYTQIWRFHDDGRIAPLLTIKKGGLHSGHTYHPHWRFDFDLNASQTDVVEYNDGKKWIRVNEEGWFPKAGHSKNDGSVWRQIDKKSGTCVSIRPYQHEDGELFAIRYNEGQSAPFTPRTSPGSHPFPADYVGSKKLNGEDVALWYVAHIHYNDSFPFVAGPWLKVSL